MSSQKLVLSEQNYFITLLCTLLRLQSLQTSYILCHANPAKFNIHVISLSQTTSQSVHQDLVAQSHTPRNPSLLIINLL